jgi:outer membrane protein OmpU
LSVSGSAEINYQTKGDGNATGNPFSDNQTMTFSGSGELDNGYTVSYSNTLTGGAGTSVKFTGSSVAIDMGDAGTIGLYGDNADGAGISTYQDVVPNAGEQVWDDTGAPTHGTINDGIVDEGVRNNIGYKVTTGDITVSASWAKAADGAEGSAVLVYDNLIDGMSIGYGVGETQEAANTKDTTDLTTMFVKYTMGAATFGVQQSSVEPTNGAGSTVATTDKDRLHFGVSFAVNENLSISAGQSDLEFDAAGLVDQTDSGISASYTMGSTTVGFVHNKTSDAQGVSGADFDVSEIKLSFAF